MSDPQYSLSPGLRKKLLPSQVKSVPAVSEDTSNDGPRIPALTKPRIYSPPLQRRVGYSVPRHSGAAKLVKGASFEEPGLKNNKDDYPTLTQSAGILATSVSPPACISSFEATYDEFPSHTDYASSPLTPPDNMYPVNSPGATSTFYAPSVLSGVNVAPKPRATETSSAATFYAPSPFANGDNPQTETAEKSSEIQGELHVHPIDQSMLTLPLQHNPTDCRELSLASSGQAQPNPSVPTELPYPLSPGQNRKKLIPIREDRKPEYV